uniref:Helicase domino n=2 Tax=Lygus hesperus TaxID=30085 RepID=A0A0K8SA08_LYGHE
MSDQQLGLNKPTYQKPGGESPSLPLAPHPTLQSGNPSMTRLGGASQGGRVPGRAPPNNGVADNSMMAALLNQTTHPNLVNSLGVSNVRKRRLPPDECVSLRRKVSENHFIRLKRLQSRYAEHVALLCFLQVNGHQGDYCSWRTRLPSSPLTNFLRTHKLNPSDENEDLYEVLETSNKTILHASSSPGRPVQGALQNDRSSPSSLPNSSTPNRQPFPSGRPPASPHKIASPTTPVPGDTNSSQEQIVERAKQEAYVMQRIGELQKDGLWAEKRLPKVHELPRAKAHWDYLLEEMTWLAADFAQERKWKKAAAKKCARMVQKYFQEKELMKQKAVKAQEMQLKRIASFIAREVKTFWTNVEKLVEFKQQTRLEEKRKKALDQHLSFIVDQTEKYSSLVAESMNTSAPSPGVKAHSDDEFEPEGSSEDDEETIAKEEAMSATNKENVSDEIDALKRESELPLEDLLSDYLQQRDKLGSPVSSNDDPGDDGDFKVSGKESSDDEETIQEQERAEGKVDYSKEIKELEDEGSMNIEDLKAKYGVTSSTSQSKQGSDSKIATIDLDSDDDSEEEESEDEEDSEEDQEEEESEEEMEVEEESDGELGSALKTLMNDGVVPESSNEDKDKEINDVAAIAQSIQPKGNTLSSTSVVTKVPFLLKHSLREYQHIGLDWLVTMYERKLNGILADEMGLGKTIQTIALLAHLACEKGNWGPHLIVVPTSVMLNWEMEIKKWCPAFKILTYYGTQKERKLKRSGWTKPNAFHICITSYKLVIQDHQSFRRKKWKYLILDEAQNIKNFKSQRWQLLLNFQTQRRLLLTGTPLQNNLMELWSLMHFLMPNVFESHREFKEWFSNPVTGMIEGSSEYNENIIKRLHKVLRPFLLRRLKSEVETQMPKKYEHVVMCRLSNRQRYLYDDFMSRAKTKETLASGNLLSVINVLMQLRKVCNHPNLFEVRPTVSPFQMERIIYTVPSLVWSALDYNPFKHVDLGFLNLLLVEFELWMLAFVSHRARRYKVPSDAILKIDSAPPPPPPCPKSRVRINLTKKMPSTSTPSPVVNNTLRQTLVQVGGNNHRILTQVGTTKVGTSPLIKTLMGPNAGQGVTLRFSNANAGGLSQCLQLLQQPGGVKAISLAGTGQMLKSSDGTRILPGLAQVVQTPAGRQIVLSSQMITSQPGGTVMTTSGQRLVLSKSGTNVAKLLNPTLTQLSPVKPTMKVPPLNITGSPNILQHNSVSSTPVVSTSNTTPNATTPVTATLTPASTPTSSPAKNSRSPVTKVKGESPTSSMKDEALLQLRKRRRQEKLAMLAKVNETRLQAMPIYGVDLVASVSCKDRLSEQDWRWSGYVNCRKAVNPDPRYHWEQTKALQEAIYSVEDRVAQLSEVFSRFVLCVPAVSATSPALYVPHPAPWKENLERQREAILEERLKHKVRLLHPISSAMSTLFPDPRLIQYDCGKLQSLDRLLRKLKTDHHRVLIFTQMTRMLDVLEAFLNFHGHIYLRLDGTTKVDQRQILMERFNADKRIFCFILSTRSGGVGVNLTGADTVVFYDSDWNPTMDAQAQDRCHRIGQTRDVHIYRLISEKTVEENILKKANQKRMLGDLAIEGGNFTTAYFKSSTIQDLFDVDTSENDASRRMADVLQRDRGDKRSDETATNITAEEKTSLGALESALAQAEDDTDVAAAKVAKAEAAAELAEFDENIPLESQEPELSKAEQELNALMQQLSGVEKYAMNFVERSESVWSAERLAAAEAEIEMQKKEWERGRLAAVKEVELQKKADNAENEDMITYSATDARNQVWVSNDGKDIMPIWGPPTPPQGDGDVYIDQNLGLLYEQKIISADMLPPVYIKKEKKRTRVEAGLPEGRLPVKVRPRDDSLMHVAPKSLFDRPTPALIKMRQEMRYHRHRGTPRPVTSLVKPLMQVKIPPEPDYVPDWTIQEDHSILQAIQNFQELTLNLIVLSPGHTPNWDMVADMVNHTSRTYRSPKQCKNRYESVIIPREEGKLVFDSPKKQKKKTNPLYKVPLQMKSGRPMRTAQLFGQDNNSTMTQIMNTRFEAIRSISNRRAPTTKPLLVNPGIKNPKHAEILAECSIDYDNPLTPVEVASKRADRIAKEKALSVQNVAVTPEQQLAALRLQQQQLQGAIVKTTTITTPTVTPTVTLATTRPVAVQEIMASPMTSRGIVSSPTSQSLSTTPRGTVANVVSVQSPGTVAKGAKTISPAQLQIYRQQQLLRQQHLRVLQSRAPAQKVSVAVTSGSPTQRVQQVKTGLTRAVSESEMLALLKRQQVTKVSTATTLSSAQLLAAQASLQAQQQTGSAGVGQVTTLVKTVPVSTSLPVANLLPQMKTLSPGLKAGTVTPQQIRQLSIQQQLIGQQRKFPQQKVTQIGQVTTKGGGTAQLIVQSQKSLPTTMTMQQIQQVMQQVKNAHPQHVVKVAQVSTAQVLPHTVFTKAQGGSQPRVIPVASSSQQPIKQAIQVVSSSGATRAIPSVTIDASGRTTANIAGTIKGGTPSQQAILTQVSAVLQQGQPITVRQPMRIQAASAPLVAVAVSQAQTLLTLPPQDNNPQQ